MRYVFALLLGLLAAAPAARAQVGPCYQGAACNITGGTITNTAISGGTGAFTTLGATGGGALGGVFTGTPTFNGVLSVTGNGVSSTATGAGLNNPNTSGADGYAQDWLWGSVRWYGKLTTMDPSAQAFAPAKIIFTDSASVTAATVTVGAFHVFHVVSGNTASSNTAPRSAANDYIAVIGQVGPTPTLGVQVDQRNFVAESALGYASASQGGLGGWSAGHNPDVGYYRGSLFAGNDSVQLHAGATNYFELNEREIDSWISPSASVYQRTALVILAEPNGHQADGDDAGIMFLSDGTSPHKVGIQFGSTTGPINFTDALIKIVPQSYPSSSTPSLVDGINLSGGTFSGNTWNDGHIRFTGGGDALMNSATPLATTATAGFFHLPNTAGAPTGKPATISGDACVVNTATFTLNCYIGSSWYHTTLTPGAG